jgi:phosphopantothenoylcysteine decarboxylase/phosphopantothenate--cysteine ligase
VALAAAAWRRGADVALIHGPLEVAPPPGPDSLEARSAGAMLDAVRSALPSADALIMAAAVADFRPAAPASEKLGKEERPDVLELTATADILASTLQDRSERLATLGFALETDGGLASARDKLARKSLDQIALNVAGADSGFETDTNRVTLLDREGREEELPVLSKDETAEAILDRFARFLR